MIPTGPYTQEQLHNLLEKNKNYDDCCFCGTLMGATKVSLFSQFLINQRLEGKEPKGKCSSLKTGYDFICRAMTCSRMHQPPEVTIDHPIERCKRCGLCVLGTVCCAIPFTTPFFGCYAVTHIRTANAQAETLAPRKQEMK